METSQTNQQINRGFTTRGAVIMSLFALIWVSAGASGLSGGALPVAVQGAGLVITAALVLLAVRGPDSAGIDRPRQMPDDWMRRFNLVGIAQGVAIGLAVLALSTTGNGGLIPAAVCLIVGAHFFPLAGVFDQPEYTWTGAALCLVAALGIATLAASDEQTSRAVVGLGAAATLWVTSLYIARFG